MTIIFCWTHPRTRSTALEKCFSSVVKTMHEPFSVSYYYRLQQDGGTGANGVIFDPRLDIQETHEFHFFNVVEKIKNVEKEHGTVFIKELAYCVVRQKAELEKHVKFFKSCRHIFLIRDPAETVPSLVHQMRRVYGSDCSMQKIGQAVGIQDLLQLSTILTFDGKVNSSDLVEQPERTIKEICRLVQIPYKDNMLKWRKNEALPDWKVWEQSGWHDDVKQTETFKEITKTYSADLCIPFIDDNREIYDKLNSM
jgi:hypothetical protein